MCGDNAALKGVIMVFVACAPVMTAGPDFRVLSHRERGSRGRGPRLMEAKQPPAPAPAVQKSAFRGKNRPPLGAHATRYINTRSNLTPPLLLILICILKKIKIQTSLLPPPSSSEF